MLVVNQQKRIVMCLVPKAACSTWLRVLLQLTGNPNATKLAGVSRYLLHPNAKAFLGRMADMSTSTRKTFLTGNYYRVMVVRDPLERFISAYRDKMCRHNYSVTAEIKQRVRFMFRSNVSRRLRGICALVLYTLHLLLSYLAVLS